MISFLIFCLPFIIVKTNNINKTKSNNILQENRVKRNVQIETDIESNYELETDAQNIYSINVTDYFFYDRLLDIHITSNPELNDNITLLFTFYIDKYNDSLGYWISKVIDIRAYDLYETGEYFSAYIEDLNLENLTSEISLTILNISVESNNKSNYYFVYFQEMTYNFPEESDSYIFDISDLSFNSSMQDTTDSIDDIESYISRDSKSSGSISMGAIIGIVAAVIVVIGISITIICICRNKKKEEDGSEMNKIKNEDNVNNINKYIRFSFSTGNQQIKTELAIKDDSTLRDMRNQYFQKIKKINLIKDENIYFLCEAQCFFLNKEGLVKDYFKDYNKVYKIIVVDQNQEEKIILETS